MNNTKLIPMSRDLINEYYESHKEEILSQANSGVKLLISPEMYAKGAIQTLQEQLKTTKSPRKKARIQSKLKQWEKTLILLENNNGQNN